MIPDSCNIMKNLIVNIEILLKAVITWPLLKCTVVLTIKSNSVGIRTCNPLVTNSVFFFFFS